MRIKKKNVARLASLSAIGAGALGVAAGTAHAGIVNLTFGPNTKVGFSSGYGTSARIDLPGTARIGVRARLSTLGNWRFMQFSRPSKSGGSVSFRMFLPPPPAYSFLGIFAAGRTWDTAGGGFNSAGPIASRSKSREYWGNSTFTDKYALFRFWDTTSSQTEYGWLQLSLSVSDTSGPDVILEAGAYDNSGNPIAAGDTGATPEPPPWP